MTEKPLSPLPPGLDPADRNRPLPRRVVLWVLLVVGLALQAGFTWLALETWPESDGDCGGYSYCSEDEAGSAAGAAVAVGLAAVGGVMTAVSVVGFGVSLGMGAYAERRDPAA